MYRFIPQPLIAVFALFCVSFQILALPGAWYQVEVIVFENPNNHTYSEGNSNNSYFQADPQAITPKANTSSTETDNYLALPSSNWTLKDVERKLKASSRKVLIHTGWRQRLIEQKSNLPIRIQGGNAISTENGSQSTLDGNLTVTLSRYLHVAADLQLLKPTAAGLERFRITESRRMRSKEIHYIDHPAFGIIIKITPEN